MRPGLGIAALCAAATVATACGERRARPHPADATVTATTTETSTRTKTATRAQAPPPVDAPPPVRLALESELDPLEVRAFWRRARLRLPRYRKAIEAHAEAHGFDWRLIVAVAYVESHFNPLAKSRTGVRGFMQLTRNTAKAMGVDNRLDARQSIRGGVRYLDKLHGLFDELLEFHRTMFAMSSYNVGYGHVRDAQRLAVRRRLDPDLYPSIRKTLPLLADPRIAALARYGRARGHEPVAYVRSICNYFVLQKVDACERRAALGRAVLGPTEVEPPPLPAALGAQATDGVLTLPWSHPYACAIEDCRWLVRPPAPAPTSPKS